MNEVEVATAKGRTPDMFSLVFMLGAIAGVLFAYKLFAVAETEKRLDEALDEIRRLRRQARAEGD